MKKEMPLPFRIPRQVLSQLADLVATAMVARIPKDVFRRRRKKKVKKSESPLVLDTSAIIDGRITEVFKLGFLVGTLIVPDFILLELKHIADSADDLKRARGRRGLELLDQMRKVRGLRLTIIESETNEGRDTDERLIVLTKKLRGKLITCDFTLNKKATLQGIKVLNINELANSLKTIALPNEVFRINLVAQGKGKNQAVGYLSDGTMVVVEEAGRLIGREVNVLVSRVYQTSAGRMIFAKLKA